MNPDSSRNQVIRRCSGLHPAIQSVISIDDLLIEILVRLPIVPLLSFKLVSKRWLSLIKEPSFTLRRSQIPRIDPPTGLYVKCTDEAAAYDLFSFKSSRFFKRFPFHIIQSCNGLILCSTGRHPHNKGILVVNLVAHWSSMISVGEHETFRIAFDPTKSFCFKVIRVVYLRIEESVIASVQVCSSDAKEWSACPDVYPYQCFCGFGNGVYWNDAIHWLNIPFGKEPSHYKFSVNGHLVLTQVQLPKLHRKLRWDIKMFATGGSLVLMCWDYEHSNLLGIYEMKNGGADWLFKYFVNLNDVLMAFGKPYWKIRRNAMSVVLGEREEDSLMVIELAGQVVEYKFKLKTFHTRCGLGSQFIT